MKKKTKDSFYKFPLNFIPVKKESVTNCYDNKPLLKWDHDDFAEYLFDNSDKENNFIPANTFLSDYPSMLDMIFAAPPLYRRVYYYGIFDCFKDLHIGKNKML